MKPFTPVTQPFEADFYSIEEDSGIKYIHIFGYSYESDSTEYVTIDNPHGIYWANMEYCGFIFPLAEFIERYKTEEDFVHNTYCELQQYQGDFSEERMAHAINHYFDGRGADGYLSFGELTMDTPVGDYISLN